MSSDIVPFVHEGELRIRDVDLGARLGFSRPEKIREIIERHLDALSAMGTNPAVGLVRRQGRNDAPYMLNKRQAIFVTFKSETATATEITIEIIEKFDAYERGALPSGARRETGPAVAGGGSREARLFMRQALQIAELAGLTGNQRVLAANRATRAATGFDYMGEMGLPYLAAPEPEVLLTATDIGKELGGMSAVKVNHELQEHGFQTGGRDDKGRAYWEPTEKGTAAGAHMIEVERSNKSGQARQLRWASSIIAELRDAISAAKAG